ASRPADHPRHGALLRPGSIPPGRAGARNHGGAGQAGRRAAHQPSRERWSGVGHLHRVRHGTGGPRGHPAAPRSASGDPGEVRPQAGLRGRLRRERRRCAGQGDRRGRLADPPVCWTCRVRSGPAGPLQLSRRKGCSTGTQGQGPSAGRHDIGLRRRWPPREFKPTMNRPRLRRSAALVALALVAMSFANAPIVTGATASTTYRPNHLVHFDAGTYTGYKFKASGGIVAAKTATLGRPSTASTRLRTSVVAHPGNWLLMVNGIWAGFYLRESNRTYLPFTRLRAVAFAAGTHTGYKFNAAGSVIAHKTYTLGRASSAHANAQALIGSSTSYLRIVDGIWAGYWVPIGAGV